jgi:hypothetical protein
VTVNKIKSEIYQDRESFLKKIVDMDVATDEVKTTSDKPPVNQSIAQTDADIS